jgi:hypothetical protein
VELLLAGAATVAALSALGFTAYQTRLMARAQELSFNLQVMERLPTHMRGAEVPKTINGLSSLLMPSWTLFRWRSLPSTDCLVSPEMARTGGAMYRTSFGTAQTCAQRSSRTPCTGQKSSLSLKRQNERFARSALGRIQIPVLRSRQLSDSQIVDVLAGF